jgi:hypothetical protein
MSRPALAFLIGLLGFIVYLAVVAIVGDFFINEHWVIQFIYYAFAGIIWVYPAKRLIYWGAGK